MNCSTKYVAMDVHQTTTVATVRSETVMLQSFSDFAWNLNVTPLQ
jgi:hypothetical protein